MKERWIPEDGEYCWFWDVRENVQIRKFREMSGNKFKPYGSVMGFTYCVEFIGELPKILKGE